ncbi:MAG: outer membrane protein assembly factor BamA [Treponema sp.]|jgi:outer membrane protein insertion porin family|nr:outer membrane protein assembly factor BamA [Treponema sp.]
MRSFQAVCLFFMLTGLCFAQGPAQGTEAPGGDWYQGKPIREIRFEGNRHTRLSDLEETIAPYRGKPFSDDLFVELQGKLYALEYFELITPQALPADSMGNEVLILFRVVERPTVSKITFVGNVGVKRRELLEAITTKVNDVANGMIIRSDEAAVRAAYGEKGFPDAAVRSETRPAKDDTVELVFYLTEGERIIITQIFFEGNKVFSSSSLRGQLSMKARGAGPGRSGAYQDAKLIADREALNRYYRNKGYLDAEVTDVVEDVTKDDKGNNNMVITYRIYEGRSYTFTGISFEGNDIFTDEQLQKLLRSKPNETANAARIEEDLQRVAGLYYENGYIYNDIRREELRNLEEGSIAFRVHIVERGRAHIENVVIRGNKKTKDSVILREIPLEPGDIYSSAKVSSAMRNLMNLQYFSTVYPDSVPGSEDGLMDLIINVEEGHTTDIMFGLTFSGSSNPDDFPVSGLLSWTDRNFLGYGNQVKAELNASTTSQSVSLQYSQRWLRDLPLNWGVDLTLSHAKKSSPMQNSSHRFNGDEPNIAFPEGYNSYTEYVNDNKSPPAEFLMDYEQWYLSLGLSSTYRWSTRLGILGAGGGARTGFINNRYEESLSPFDPVIRERNKEWTPVNSLWTIAFLDNRDLYYDPSRGYYASQRFSFHGFFPVELEHYIRSDTKAEFFFTLINVPVTDKWNFKTVLALHSGLSFIFPQFGMDTPVVEDVNRLYIDGMFIGRGWYSERMNRGTALWENWAELRVPLVPNLLAFDMFFDADLASGIVASQTNPPYSSNLVTPAEFFSHMDAEYWRFSYGGGLRFTIAQFPFRFLLAKRFTIEDGRVRFKPGSMFRQANDPTSGLDFVISFAIPTS